MKKYFFYLPIILLITSLESQAQVGGNYVYTFLNLSNSSRISALGGTLIAVHDDDPTMILQNPSMIAPRHHTSLAMNFTDYFTNASYGSALYSHTFKKVGSFAFGMQYANYGKFIETNESGDELGYFSANDFVATVGWGRQLDSSFSIGANLKMIYSGYESYNSFGLAVDVAGSYYNKKKQIALTLMLKNIGSQLDPYTKGNFEKIPFEIQLSFSQRFKHLPVRYHISLHNLQRWNMSYVGPENPFLERSAETNELVYPSKASQFFNNFFRHIVFGLEIIPVKYLSLQISYNHNRNQDMRIPQKKSFAGFSYGFMLYINSIQVGFSRSHYAVGAVPNYFTFAANINELSKLSKEKKTRKLERVN